MALYSEIMKTALNQLEDWILKFERQNGTPTMCEIKAQLEMFKEVERTQIIDAHINGCEHMYSYTTGAENYYNFTFLDSNEAII